MTAVRRFITYQLKRKDPASWESENPVLAFGEPGVSGIAGSGEVGSIKIGDGVTPWNDLPAAAASEADVAAAMAAAMAASDPLGSADAAQAAAIAASDSLGSADAAQAAAAIDATAKANAAQAAAEAASEPLGAADAARDEAIAAASIDATAKADAAEAAAIAVSQPLDADLTAIAELTTTEYGRALLALANQVALMALLSMATDSDAGKVELATSAETVAGMDSSRATHPAGVKAAIDAAVTTLLDDLVGIAPESLNQIHELAAAIGDDPNFAVTVANQIAGRQPLHETLTALAGLALSADRLVYSTGADALALAPLTAFARTMLDDADAATVRATIGAAPVANPTFTGNVVVPNADAAGEAVNKGQLDAVASAAALDATTKANAAQAAAALDATTKADTAEENAVARSFGVLVSAIPPTTPVPGTTWMMTPEEHVAVFGLNSWIPLYPPTDNEAVVAGNALLNPTGFWLAGDI